MSSPPSKENEMLATLEAKLIAGALLLTIITGSFLAYTYHERSIGSEKELAALKKSSAELIAKDDAEIAELTAKYDKVTADLLEKTDEADKANTARAASDADRLRQFNAYRSQLAKLQGAASPAKAPSGGTSSPNQSEDFIGELGLAGVALADSLRDTVTALNACMEDRTNASSQ
jgi:hypothetical protein